MAVQFKGGRDPVEARGERLVGSTESSLREWASPGGGLCRGLPSWIRLKHSE